MANSANDSFESQGLWWLPNAPDQKTPGILTWSPENGARLTLLGVLGEPKELGESKATPTILGLLWDCRLGEAATLCDCFVAGLRLGSNRPAREEYYGSMLFIGSEHINSDQGVAFNRATVTYSGLSSWAADFSGFSKQEQRTAAGKYSIEWEPRPPHTASIGDVKLGLSLTANVSRENRKESIEESVSFSIEREKRWTSVADLSRSYAYPLQNLMTLACDRPCSQTQLIVFDGDVPAHVLATRAFRTTEDKPLYPHQMLFALSDVSHRFGSFLGEWIAFSSKYRDVCNSYFSIQYQTGVFIDVALLLLIRTIEIYSRDMGDGTRGGGASPDTPRSAIESVLGRQWNYVSKLWPLGPEAAITQIVEYRNRVVHGHDASNGEDDKGAAMYWLIQKLMFVMKTCFLGELGFSEHEIHELLSRNQQFHHVAANSRDV